MDPQLSAPQTARRTDQPPVLGAYPPPGSRGAGRRPRPGPDFATLAGHLARGIRHFFPEWNTWLDQLPDPRNPDDIVYHRRHLIWSGVLLFLLHLASRHQWTLERLSAGLLHNLTRLAHTTETTLAHADTLVRYLARIPASALAELLARLVRRLIRMRCLDGFRLQGRLLVAVDATEIWTSPTLHCPYCLHRRLSHGRLQYYHVVLEAKWVTANGLALSLATEFVQNDERAPTEELSEERRKQDSEQKAFPRLAAQLHRFFPQTAWCLLLDALYENRSAIGLCERYGWTFITTFKEGAAPAIWAEAGALRRLQAPEHPARTLQHPDGTRCSFQWANRLPFGPYELSAIWCEEHSPHREMRRFAWITNLAVDAGSVIPLAEGGGRLRWKIENEGFRQQKHGGFALKHIYCRHPVAAQSLYRLLQIAHLLQQLVWAGDLLKELKPLLKTIRNFIRRLADALHHTLLPPDEAIPALGQVRWNSG